MKARQKEGGTVERRFGEDGVCPSENSSLAVVKYEDVTLVMPQSYSNRDGKGILPRS